MDDAWSVGDIISIPMIVLGLIAGFGNIPVFIESSGPDEILSPGERKLRWLRIPYVIFSVLLLGGGIGLAVFT